jgi:hypothetical protein
MSDASRDFVLLRNQSVSRNREILGSSRIQLHAFQDRAGESIEIPRIPSIIDGSAFVRRKSSVVSTEAGEKRLNLKMTDFLILLITN